MHRVTQHPNAIPGGAIFTSPSNDTQQSRYEMGRRDDRTTSETSSFIGLPDLQQCSFIDSSGRHTSATGSSSSSFVQRHRDGSVGDVVNPAMVEGGSRMLWKEETATPVSPPPFMTKSSSTGELGKVSPTSASGKSPKALPSLSSILRGRVPFDNLKKKNKKKKQLQSRGNTVLQKQQSKIQRNEAWDQQQQDMTESSTGGAGIEEFDEERRHYERATSAKSVETEDYKRLCEKNEQMEKEIQRLKKKLIKKKNKKKKRKQSKKEKESNYGETTPFVHPYYDNTTTTTSIDMTGKATSNLHPIEMMAASQTSISTTSSAVAPVMAAVTTERYEDFIHDMERSMRSLVKTTKHQNERISYLEMACSQNGIAIEKDDRDDDDDAEDFDDEENAASASSTLMNSFGDDQLTEEEQRSLSPSSLQQEQQQDYDVIDATETSYTSYDDIWEATLMTPKQVMKTPLNSMIRQHVGSFDAIMEESGHNPMMVPDSATTTDDSATMVTNESRMTPMDDNKSMVTNESRMTTDEDLMFSLDEENTYDGDFVVDGDDQPEPTRGSNNSYAREASIDLDDLDDLMDTMGGKRRTMMNNSNLSSAAGASSTSISHHARHPRRSILRPSMVPSERYSSVHDNSWFNLTYGSYMDYSFDWSCVMNLEDDTTSGSTPNPGGGSGQSGPLGRRSMLMRSSMPMNRATRFININTADGADGGICQNRHLALSRALSRRSMMKSSVPMNRTHISRSGVGASINENEPSPTSSVPLWSVQK